MINFREAFIGYKHKPGMQNAVQHAARDLADECRRSAARTWASSILPFEKGTNIMRLLSNLHLESFLFSCLLLANTVLAQGVPAANGPEVLIGDPAETTRQVKTTKLIFEQSKEFEFSIHFSNVSSSSPLRLVVYESAPLPQSSDCLQVVCWRESIFSSSSSDQSGLTIKRTMKKGAQLLVVAWQGGNSRSRGGDPIFLDCNGSTICGGILEPESAGSSLQLKLKSLSGEATLSIKPSN
jgi:hypothetical protein